MSAAPDLPALTRDQPPAFISAATCREWLSHVPLVNPQQAQATLVAQINLLNRFAMPAAERLRILETLREPVHFVTEESARKFTARALPLTSAEQSVLETNLRLYRSLGTGYRLCLEACANREEGAGHAGTAAQRALAEMACEQHDSYLAANEIAPHFWRRLYALYAAAEALGATRSETSDKLLSRRAICAQAVFAYVLLMQRASPHELTARQIALLRGWILHWSGLVDVTPLPPAGAKMPALLADLNGEGPARSSPAEPGEGHRWLDVAPIAGKFKRRIAALQGGASPESLGLGEGTSQAGCEQLLRHAYEHCCRGGVSRDQPRRAATGECRLAAGLEAAFYYVGRVPFRQPSSGAALTKKQVDEIATFGRISMRETENFSEQQGFRAEAWQILDDSPAGLRASRAERSLGGRVARKQLLAVAVSQGAAFLLGCARWAMRSEDGQIRIGVRILPGAPQAIIVRPCGSAHVRDKWQPGFLLPPVPALKEAPSIVLPAGWQRDGRLIDIWDTPRRTLRLGQLIERGFDFDRVAYQPA